MAGQINTDGDKTWNLNFGKRPMKMQKLSQIKPNQTPDIYDMRFTIYEVVETSGCLFWIRMLWLQAKASAFDRLRRDRVSPPAVAGFATALSKTQRVGRAVGKMDLCRGSQHSRTRTRTRTRRRDSRPSMTSDIPTKTSRVFLQGPGRRAFEDEVLAYGHHTGPTTIKSHDIPSNPKVFEPNFFRVVVRGTSVLVRAGLAIRRGWNGGFMAEIVTLVSVGLRLA